MVYDEIQILAHFGRLVFSLREVVVRKELSICGS